MRRTDLGRETFPEFGCFNSLPLTCGASMCLLIWITNATDLNHESPFDIDGVLFRSSTVE